jgi:hypothetical protein
LGVKDPILANLALGEKMLWRMITKYYTNWKKEMVFKYFHGDRLRGVELHINTTTSSLIWNFLQASIPLLQSQLSWILGNGRCISIWEEKILNRAPLIQDYTLNIHGMASFSKKILSP